MRMMRHRKSLDPYHPPIGCEDCVQTSRCGYLHNGTTCIQSVLCEARVEITQEREAMKEITRSEITDVIQANKSVVILFFNEDCSPCKVQKTILKGVVRKNPDVKFFKVPTAMEGEGPGGN